MKVEFKRSFARDLERINDKGLKQRVKEVMQRVEEDNGLATREVGSWSEKKLWNRRVLPVRGHSGKQLPRS